MGTIIEILKKFKSDKITLETAEEQIYNIIRKYKNEILEQIEDEKKTSRRNS